MAFSNDLLSAGGFNPPVLFCAQTPDSRKSDKGTVFCRGPPRGCIPAHMPATGSTRLAYIDWMRGLACVLMFQTHCYDAWLNDSSRRSDLFTWSQLGGTFPAPLFLFLAGISFALVTHKLRGKGLTSARIAGTTIGRGAEILALGILFRLQEYAVSWGWAPWSDLLRVDILNEIGVSLVLLGIACWAFYLGERDQFRMVAIPAGIGLTISLLSPLLWTSWRPDWLPWPVESYINGVHNLGKPQAWLFPIFPWSGFAFVGLAVGFLLLSDWGQKLGSRIFISAALAGIALVYFGRWIEAQPYRLYPTDDFWHTSPSFFLIRVGFLLVILGAAYCWCRWGLGQWRFSPLIQLGHTSLLVYWVHIEFVYGRFSILPHRGVSIRKASLGLLTIFLAMLLLSMLRTRFKSRSAILAPGREPAAAAS
ncbi:MAG TPA: heparan-alpha-glucosaminide N-acetyltransferase domain-containing protein [Terriglobales bacterium]|nr:heparan-alpha-glucosaminide N-acetyltransferase domain-containing protein [Terriglobales bacterium]